MPPAASPARPCEYLDIRDVRYHVRHWGEAAAPKVFFLHGWMDSSPTFQFVAAALGRDWHVIAPDWRGYGASTWLKRPYNFADYYADLDALLAHYSPEAPVSLVGHSMGGNIAGIYAGVRPERVARLALLDFLGLKPPAGQHAADVLGAWLAGQRQPPRLRRYPDAAGLARQLCAVNPRLLPERALALAETVGRPLPDGGYGMACDPWHKLPGPYPYHIEDTLAVWRRVTAPVLLVVAEQGFVAQRFGADPAEFARRAGCFRRHRIVRIADAGHNLQHDQPEAVAAALAAFWREPLPAAAGHAAWPGA